MRPARRIATPLLFTTAAIAFAATLDPAAIRSKLELVTHLKAEPGSTVTFTDREISTFAVSELPNVVPQGIRDPKVAFAKNTLELSALVDFAKVRQSRGAAPGWSDKFIEGEHPVKVILSVHSSHGVCTMDLRKLEVAGLSLPANVVQLAARTLMLAVFPKGKLGDPFPLDYQIERLDLTPGIAAVTIRK